MHNHIYSAKQSGGVFTSLAGRYAKALFELAFEQGQVDIVAKNLQTFAKTLSTSHVLKEVLASPAFTKVERQRLLQELLKKLKFSALGQTFLIYLVNQRRLHHLSSIINLYQQLSDAEKGIRPIDIITAFPLTSSQTKQLTKLVQSITHYVPKLSFSIDPSLLGGIVLKYDKRQIDASLSNQLNQLRILMKEAI